MQHNIKNNVMKINRKVLNKVRRVKASVRLFITPNRWLIHFVSISKYITTGYKTEYPINPATIKTPEIMNMPVFINAQHIFSEKYEYPELFTGVITGQAIFNPEYNIVLDGDHSIIIETSATMCEGKYFDRHIITRKPTKEILGFSTPLRSVSNNYYHVLIDLLPRLFALFHEPYTKFELINLIYTGKLTNVEKFWLDRILPDNVKLLNVEGGENYKLENYVYLPFLTRQFAGYLPSEYLEYVLPKALPTRPRKRCNRIYISRKKAAYRIVRNEDELIDALEKYGFVSYELENYTVEEQINIFYDAEIVISPHGAGLTNLIYAENCYVLELFANSTVKPSYYTISKSVGHVYDYLCSNESWINDDFTADVDMILHKLSCR